MRGAVLDEPKPLVTDRPDRERAEATSRSSFYGTDDLYCHIFVGSPPYRFTRCGQQLEPPVPLELSHPEPPCPNGNPACPECLLVRADDVL